VARITTMFSSSNASFQAVAISSVCLGVYTSSKPPALNWESVEGSIRTACIAITRADTPTSQKISLLAPVIQNAITPTRLRYINYVTIGSPGHSLVTYAK
jgi:hypothetical protein